jgi:dTDP-4-amino-4,6-dideoxygalactose transaminase
MIPITQVQFGPEEEELVLKVLRSGNIAQGPVVAEFEKRFAELVGVKHAIAVNNGTTSLVASLQVMDLEPGDEVLTSPFTFVATVNAALEAGASVTFADINESDFNLNPASVREQVTSRTKVLIPVHLYGQTADMGPLMDIAQANDLFVLEDSAQSHGATYEGKQAGSFGIGSFSFYATKNLTTGEGGIITTNDDKLADRLRVLRNQGMRERYVYEVAGHNYRMTDLQAAVVIPQLDRYSATIAQRRENAAILTAGLEGVKGLVTPPTFENRGHVWHQYTIRVTEESSVTREEVVRKIQEAGVGAGIYYPKLIGDYEAYSANPRVKISETPVAKKIASQVISIPVHQGLSRDDLNRVIEVVTEAIRN